MEQQHNQEAQEQIDLSRLLWNFWRLLKRWWVLIPALTLVFGGLRYLQLWLTYQPQYTASATFSVTTGLDSTTDILNGSSRYDTQAAKRVVESFPYIITSEAMRERIKETLNVSRVAGRVNVPESIGDSNFYILSATSTSPQMALDLLNAVIDNYPQVASFVVGSTQLNMLEEPTLPVVPSNSQNALRSALKFAAVGFALSCILIFVFSLGRYTVLKPEDLREEVSLHCFGKIPMARRTKRRKKGSGGISLLNKNAKKQLGDAFSSVQVKLLRELEAENHRMILVTSTLPGEGKTTVSVNLALSMAMSGHSVILVDADLRNQVVKSCCGIQKKSIGLAELLKDRSLRLEDALQEVEGTSLKLLAGDTKVPKAMDLIDSVQMRRVLRDLRELADYIIIDAPPCGILGDAAILGRSADRILYVVRYDAVPRRQIVDGIMSLSRRNVALCGYVLNGWERTSSSHYSYYSKYGYDRPERRSSSTRKRRSEAE